VEVRRIHLLHKSSTNFGAAAPQASTTTGRRFLSGNFELSLTFGALHRVARFSAVASCSITVHAQESNRSEAFIKLDPVVVTATRVETPSFDIPASIDAVELERIQLGQPLVNLPDTLVSIPAQHQHWSRIPLHRSLLWQ